MADKLCIGLSYHMYDKKLFLSGQSSDFRGLVGKFDL